MSDLSRTEFRIFRLHIGFLVLLPFLAPSSRASGGPTLAATSAFDGYAKSVEFRLAQQHRSKVGFLVPIHEGSLNDTRLQNGEILVERIEPSLSVDLSGAMLHHWSGTAFAPGARASDLDRLLRAIDSYPHIYAPEILKARVVAQNGDHVHATMRIRQKHVLTVVLDTDYDIEFHRPDKFDEPGDSRGFSYSRSTRISEIDSHGTSGERALAADEDHGFLWRLNTYWSYEERDGGLYIQVESISLTRSIPNGLGWALRPYIESVPRESMEFTLRSTCRAIRR